MKRLTGAVTLACLVMLWPVTPSGRGPATGPAAPAAREMGPGPPRAQMGAVNLAPESAWRQAEPSTSLVWSSLNRTVPEVAAAVKYARTTLALVSSWRHLLDVLMHQIQSAATLVDRSYRPARW